MEENKIFIKKILIFLIFIFLLLIFSYGEEIFYLYFLNEKDKIIVTPIFKGQEIYFPITLVSSLLDSTFKIEKDKILIIKDKNEFFSGNINKRDCILKGKSYRLLEPVLSISNDFYIPIKSFFSFLGYRVIVKDKNIYIVQVLDKIYFEKERIYIKIRSEDYINYRNFKLKDPNRLVFDLYECVLIEKGEIVPNISGIKTIRYSQFSNEPYIVRIVIEFFQDFVEPKIYLEKGCIVLEFKNKLTEENIDESSIKRLKDVKWTKDDKNLIFNFIFDSSFTYTKGILKNPDRIFFDLPEIVSSYTETLIVNEKPIEKIRFGFPNSDSKIFRIVFDLYTSTIFKEEVFTDTLKIMFPIINEKENIEKVIKNLTIIIDPGHGGSDPGAIYSNILEKDLNLQVSLKISKLLKESGYDVILLRENDTTISLDDRVNMVKNLLRDNNNKNNKIIYISIHANAATSPDVKGIEILYANDFSFPMAKLFSEILSKYFFVRSLKMGKFYVLSRIPIPGIIIEMGFLSNDEERKILISDEFQNKFIESIKEAIEYYNK